MTDRPELRADDERIRDVLGNPDAVIVSWMIVARTASVDGCGGVICATDDQCDLVTHAGLALVADTDARQRIAALHEPDDD